MCSGSDTKEKEAILFESRRGDGVSTKDQIVYSPNEDYFEMICRIFINSSNQNMALTLRHKIYGLFSGQVIEAFPIFFFFLFFPGQVIEELVLLKMDAMSGHLFFSYNSN